MGGYVVNIPGRKRKGGLSGQDSRQVAKDLKELLRLFLSIDPEVLKLLSGSVALAKQVKEDGSQISLESLLALASELGESRSKTLLAYQDIRLLEERHPSGGLSLRDLALLECRHVLGREAFLELVASDTFQWLDSLPLSTLFREESAGRRGAPLKPLTIGTNIKLSLLVPPQRIIDDEIEDNLRECGSEHEKRTHRRRIAQRAAKRVERVLKRAGIPDVNRFDQFTDAFGPKELRSGQK
jgi:hypothetical protein